MKNTELIERPFIRVGKKGHFMDLLYITASLILFGAILIGLIPAAIASAKGYSFLGWWFFGAMLFIVAFPMSLFMQRRAPQILATPQSQNRACPSCAELIKIEAIKCRFCGHSFAQQLQAAS